MDTRKTAIQTYVIIIKMLKKRGADLYDPENVKKGHSPTAELEQRQKMERRESLNTLSQDAGLNLGKNKVQTSRSYLSYQPRKR